MAEKTQLLGPDGRPVDLRRDSKERAIDFLTKRGAHLEQNGDLVIPDDALNRMRDERIRDATVTSVPSTPRWLARDGGGMGVRKGHSRFETFSLAALRKFRERSVMIQAIHAARHYQMRRMSRHWNGKPGDVGWRVVHKDHWEHHADTPEEIKPFIQRAENMLEHPSGRYCPTLGQLLVGLEEDLLTINRPVCEKLYSLFDRQRCVGFKACDGETIWPTMLYVEKWMQDTPDWYGGYSPAQLSNEQVLDLASQVIGEDLLGKPYCLVREGILEGVYGPDKLIVAPIVNRTDITVAGYPPSHVEQAIEIILTAINTWDLNASLMTRGMMTEFFLGISGDVHDEDIAAFVDMFRESTQGVRNAWSIPVIPLPTDGTITKIDMRPNAKEMLMDMFMSLQASLMTAVYRMDLSCLGLKKWEGGGGSHLGGEGGRGLEIATAKEEGLEGDIQHLTDNIFNPILAGIHPDLRMVWEFGDQDIAKEAENQKARCSVASTRNEIRLENGDPPMGFWLEPSHYETASEEEKQKFMDNPWNWPSDPAFGSAISQQKMQEQMAQQGQQGQPDNGFGAAPGEDVDGFGAPPGGGHPTYPFGQPQQGQPGKPPGAPPQGPPAPGGKPPASGAPPGAQQPMGKATPRTITVYVEDHDHAD